MFEAEKMVAQSGWYHRHCFRCFLCSQPVDSTSVCDGPDDKIYCRVCYGRIRSVSSSPGISSDRTHISNLGGKFEFQPLLGLLPPGYRDKFARSNFI